MPEELPPTIKALEAKIADLEKKLAAGAGLEDRMKTHLADQLAALRKELADAKAADSETEEKPKRGLYWW